MHPFPDTDTQNRGNLMNKSQTSFYHINILSALGRQDIRLLRLQTPHWLCHQILSADTADVWSADTAMSSRLVCRTITSARNYFLCGCARMSPCAHAWAHTMWHGAVHWPKHAQAQQCAKTIQAKPTWGQGKTAHNELPAHGKFIL